jgi:hypothetical protein
VQKSEKPSHGLDLDSDPKLIDGLNHRDETDHFEIESKLKKKLDKIEMDIRAENEVYPKDAPYTQGGALYTSPIFYTTHLTCLTMITLLTFLLN